MQEHTDEPATCGEFEMPRSSVHQGAVLVGLVSFAATLLFLFAWQPADRTLALGTLLLAIAAPIAALEAFRNRRTLFAALPLASVRLDRVAIKLAGLGATFAVIAVAYWAFPIYRDEQGPVVWSLLYIFGLPLILVAPAYVWLTDRRMEVPEDGLYMAGLAVFGRWNEIEREQLVQYGLGWLIKAFFLPLMLWNALGDLTWLLSISPLSMVREWPYGWFQFTYRLVFFTDVLWASVGYFCTFRLIGTHIRSSDSTAVGWAVCLACYHPFWTVVSGKYLSYSHIDWGDWFGSYAAFGLAWAGTILLFTVILVWADVSFGIRFSNLTHRGIITNGPYRWSKHPCYIAKNIHWWMISVPFLSQVSVTEAVRHCLLLSGVNAIYYWRARTEEAHLSRDPVYRAYSAFIRRHGLIAIVKRWWHAVRKSAH